MGEVCRAKIVPYLSMREAPEGRSRTGLKATEEDGETAPRLSVPGVGLRREFPWLAVSRSCWHGSGDKKWVLPGTWPQDSHQGPWTHRRWSPKPLRWVSGQSDLGPRTPSVPRYWVPAGSGAQCCPMTSAWSEGTLSVSLLVHHTCLLKQGTKLGTQLQTGNCSGGLRRGGRGVQCLHKSWALTSPGFGGLAVGLQTMVTV